MKIPVRTSIDNFFIQLVELMSSFAPIKNLKGKEKMVLAEILYQNYTYKEFNERERNILIFSPENRKEMQRRLNISEDYFNNQLTKLRKNGALGLHNKLPKFLSAILPNERFEFTVIFNLIKDE